MICTVSCPLIQPALFVQLLEAYIIVSEYDQEIPHTQIADKPMAPRGRATQPSRETRRTNN